MPAYAFHCFDGEEAPRIRPRVRDAHFAHIEAHAASYRLGGPLKRAGEAIGSLIIIEAADEAAARAIFESDPYYLAGVWQSINATEFVPLTGTWCPPEDGV
jgi:uncharacterized protein YciI